MRRKFDYFVNKNKMSRKEFIEELKQCCYKVVDTDMIGCIGIDFCEFDEKLFNKEMRAINQGITVIFFDNNKTFERKEAI